MPVVRDPVLASLFWGSVAAVTAAIGAVPFMRPGGVRRGAIGLAYALASGFMLAGSFLLLEAGLRRAAVPLVAGAVGGAAISWWIHHYTGVDRAPLPGARPADDSEAGGYRVLLQSALHSATEGLAIGAAFLVSIQLGVFTALTLAIHNIAEGMVLSDELRRRGMSVGDAAGLCVITNVTQPLLAVAACAVVASAPQVLTPLLGVAGGSLLYLVMSELLPGSYARTGKTAVAFTVATSAAFIVMLRDLLE